MLKVYLAGPMSGLTWRQSAARRSPYFTLFERDLGWRMVKLLDPLRGKMPADLDTLVSPTEGLQGMGPRQIQERDLNDVRRCDVVLADVRGASEVSVGTVWEMAVAKEHFKPCIVVMASPENPHQHLFIREGTTVILPSAAEAVQWIKECYL